MKLILWLWWMYCGYLFGVGGDKKEYDKRYIYFSFAESNQNKHMTPTRYDSTHFDTFPLLSLPTTLKTKTNLKFSLRQGSIRSQCISNRFCFISTSVSRKAIKTSTWPQQDMIPHISIRFRYSVYQLMTLNDVINPDCAQWITLGIFLQIVS